MVPYADFLYFGVALYLLLPTLVVRLLGRFSRAWILLATLLMLLVQYAGTVALGSQLALREVWLVAGYALFQLLVATVFLPLRARTGHWVYYSALALALLPLIAVKVVPVLAPGTQLGYLGISYVTFRSLDVIFGIQDRLITTLPAGQFLAYLFLFPTVSSGPVDRYRRFAEDWNKRPDRSRFLADLDGAVHRIFTGFLYKFILAAVVKRYWLDPAAAGTGLLATLSYMYAYSLYLFFDFAGYSALAIGFSYLLGVHTPENFNRPFLAHNIKDFWNRWHIGLSTWFRDHVYMRFVMAATKGRWFKRRFTASYLGFFLGFGLMGLWHGTALHYLIYGLYHAALLVGHDVFVQWNRRRKLWGDGPLWHAAGIVVTVQLVCFGFLIFSGHIGPTWYHDTPAVEQRAAQPLEYPRPVVDRQSAPLQQSGGLLANGNHTRAVAAP
jgi:membrane protein involved in D-alanine export